jgi:hypothetical protein
MGDILFAQITIEGHVVGNSFTCPVLLILKSHPSVAAGLAHAGSERVPIFMLDSIANRYFDKNSNLFIKIDTKGYE